MSYPPEPPEPNPEEEEQYHEERVAKESSGVTITGLSEEAVQSAIRGVLESQYNLCDRYERMLVERLDKKVGEISAASAREAVGAAVERVLDQGIPEFDSYTGKEKSRTTISQMIEKELMAKFRDSYETRGSAGLTILEVMIKKKIDALFDKEFNVIVAEAKKKFSAQVDSVVMAKLAETLKGALGLR